jgi:hypothetical protein
MKPAGSLRGLTGATTTGSAAFAMVAALLVAVLLAGCGSSSGSGASQQALRRALKAAACMRANGVRNYPEPRLIDGTVRISFTALVNPTTPAVHTAVRKCGHQAEQQAGETSSRIAFARCMRTHGVRNFPYPTAQGHVSAAMVRARGIRPQSPAVVGAEGACLPAWLRPPPAA